MCVKVVCKQICLVDVCSSDSGWFVSHRVVHLFICKGVCARVCVCVKKREKGDERENETKHDTYKMK